MAKENKKSTNNNLYSFHGTWKILSPEGRFLAWASGSITDALWKAQELGLRECEIIPSEAAV